VQSGSCQGSNARRVSKEFKFEAQDGRMVKVSNMMVSRRAKKENLVLSQPKVRGIRVHFSHHQKMRMAHCKWILSLSPAQLQGVWYSDEMAWYIHFKNDVKYVNKGEQSTTNMHRLHKGDTSKIFWMWWCINKSGVVAFRCYTEGMGVEYFQKVLQEDLKPRIKDFARDRAKLRHFYHDHVTNSNILYDETKMNDVFGAGKWIQFAPPICRQPDGQMWIEPGVN